MLCDFTSSGWSCSFHSVLVSPSAKAAGCKIYNRKKYRSHAKMNAWMRFTGKLLPLNVSAARSHFCHSQVIALNSVHVSHHWASQKAAI